MAGDDAGAPAAGETAGGGSVDRLAVALVRGVHGLRGAVRVEILTDRPEERYAVGSVLLREGSDQPLTVVWSSPVADGPGWRIQFAEVPDRTAAETLKGVYLEVETGPARRLPRGSYFWHEVIGTPVSSTTGEALGTVRDVYRSGGAEVYTVAGGPYGEFDVPGVRDFVRIFAPRRGEIVVDTAALDLAPLPAPDRGERKRAPRRRPGSRRRGGAAVDPSSETSARREATTDVSTTDDATMDEPTRSPAPGDGAAEDDAGTIR